MDAKVEGLHGKKISSYRQIETRDVSTRQKRKTFSDWPVFISYLTNELPPRACEAMFQNPTEEEMSASHKMVKYHLPIDTVTTKHHERREAQMKLVTVLRLLR